MKCFSTSRNKRIFINKSFVNSKYIKLFLGIAGSLVSILIFDAGIVFAVVTVTPASGGSVISADTTGGAYTALTGPVIAESVTADIGAGTVILNAPSGFIFDVGGVAPTVLITWLGGGSGAGGNNINNKVSGTVDGITSITTTQITYTITAMTDVLAVNSLTWQNVRVRPTAGTPLVSGNIIKTGTSVISGVTNSVTNFGTLTEVAGAKTQLVYTTQPSATATADVDFTTKPVIAVRDQFGNTVISDNATTIVHAAVLSTQTCGGTAGSGTLTSAPVSTAVVSGGVMAYTAMRYSFGESIKICATSAGIASALSNTIAVSNPVPATTSISPISKTAGDSGFTLTVSGTNFISSSVVRFNGLDRTTAFVSAVQLTASILSSDITGAGSFSVTVFNSTPGGGVSNEQMFTVNAAPLPPPPPSSSSALACSNDGYAINQLVGCLWSGTNFNAQSGNAPSGPVFSSPVPDSATALEYNWGINAPNFSLGGDFFSAQWLGIFTFKAGEYVFYAGADDGIRLKIDSATVIDSFINSNYSERAYTHTFSFAGTHFIELEYYENQNDARVSLRWTYSTPVVPSPPPAPIPESPSPPPVISPTVPPVPPAEALPLEQPQIIVRPPVKAQVLPSLPQVRVPLYPDMSRWYNYLGDIIVLWDVPDDVVGVATIIDHSPNTAPQMAEKELATGKKFGVLEEGIWYAHVRFRNNIGRGPTAHYRIAIDTKPPRVFEIILPEGEVTDNPAPILRFRTSDELSGLEKYQIKIDDGETIQLAATEFLGSFALPIQVPGKREVVIQAVDLAGNSTEDDVTLDIIPIPSPVITFITTELFSDESKGLTVIGTALPDSNVLLEVKQALKHTGGEVVAKVATKADDKGNWEFTFSEPLRNGKYIVAVQSQDSRGAVSLVVESEEVQVRDKPVIQVGPLRLGKGGAALILLAVLAVSFSAGAWFYRKRQGQLVLRVGSVGNEVTKIFKLIGEDIERVSQARQTPTLGDDEYAFKRLQENIKRMEGYLKKGIEKIKK